MSGFDSNPFGDPETNNPFADPSVTQVTQNAANTQKGLEEYNPFADQGSGHTPSVRGAANPPQYQPPMTQGQSTNYPAVMQPTAEPPPAYTPNAPRISTDELQRRQEELERKAAELQRREEELRNVPFNSRNNNWPPLPEKFCVQPCFYQDINVDIPMEFQKTVRTVYYLWMFDACVMFLNVLGGLALLIGVGDGYTFGLAIVYFVVFTPFAYICWFRPIYKAFRSDSSFNFFVFFFIFFFNCVLKGIFAIGIPSMGACGFILGLTTIRNPGGVTGYAVGGIVLIIGFLFAVVNLLSVVILLKVVVAYIANGFVLGACFEITSFLICACWSACAIIKFGWIVTIQAYTQNLGAGICSTLVSIGLTCMTLANIFMLLKIHRIYRNSEASFAKAQQEFATGVLRNEHVQNAASNAAAGAVRQSMAANTGSRY